MKVCHFNAFTPNRQGMYETGKELVLAQNKLGIESAMHDPLNPSSWGKSDGELKIVDKKWAMNSDVWVIHSIIPNEYRPTKPTVLMAHGMPEAVLHDEMAFDGVTGFRLRDGFPVNVKDNNNVTRTVARSKMEFIKELPFTSIINYMRSDWVDALITFWPRHLPYWEKYSCGKICEYVPGGVDLKKYNPNGKVMRYKGNPSFVYADMFRFVKHPLDIIHAFDMVARARSSAKLALIGCPPHQTPFWDNLFATGKMVPMVSNMHVGPHNDMPSIYRGNDCLISPCVDSSRTTKEALACGMPVLSEQIGFEYRITKDLDQIRDTILRFIDDYERDKAGMRLKAREYAEKNYDINKTAEGCIRVYERLLNERKDRKV